MATRRQFLKLSAAVGAGLYLYPTLGPVARVFGKTPAVRTPAMGTVAPSDIPKYAEPLIIPPAMPSSGTVVVGGGKNADYYEIAVRQFQQNILPAGMGRPTTVWSYGSVNHPGTFNYPAFTIEARVDKPVRVKWINQLVDANGNYLQHLLPVDPTLHWANPPGPRDERPTFSSTPGRYTGPVPITTHLHGGHSAEESDGYAEAWYLPIANNTPAGYFTEGTWYNTFKTKFFDKFGVQWEPGTATFQYENDQRTGTEWYHDHTLGMTRLNVYAGPAGFYLLRGGANDLSGNELPKPAPALGDPAGAKYYEIPIAIQDRSFNDDGSLFYPDSRAFFDGYTGPFIPDTPVSPIWNPEFFANTIVVNGRTWPYLEVEQRRYRFRFLNGCNSRFLILKMVTDPLATRPAAAALPFWQIGTDGGFLPAPVQLSQLLMANAERADVVVDFSNVPVGADIYLINEGPDEPFGGFAGLVPADPNTTGQVMKFHVVPASGKDKSDRPDQLKLPKFVGLGPESNTRSVTLQEEEFMSMPTEVLLGTGTNTSPVPKLWSDPITENPALNAIEVWEIYNNTVDAHPIHIHEVLFQVVNRQPFGGQTRSPEAWEVGYKDTVIAYPGEITRVKAKFDLPGQYVWHCHIVEHEDNEMMRPYRVGPPDPTAPV